MQCIWSAWWLGDDENRICYTKYVIHIFSWVTSFCFAFYCYVLCAHFHSLFFHSLIPQRCNWMGSFNGCLPVIRNSQLFHQSQMSLYKRTLFLYLAKRPLMCIYYLRLWLLMDQQTPPAFLLFFKWYNKQYTNKMMIMSLFSSISYKGEILFNASHLGLGFGARRPQCV